MTSKAITIYSVGHCCGFTVTVVALQILLNDTYKLNHCKEMGAKLGRRFLKQPAEKLKAVFVAKNK